MAFLTTRRQVRSNRGGAYGENRPVDFFVYLFSLFLVLLLVILLLHFFGYRFAERKSKQPRPRRCRVACMGYDN